MSLSSKTSFHHNMLPHHKEMLTDTLLIQLPICQILYFLSNIQALLRSVPSLIITWTSIMSPKMGLLESAWPPVWLNLWLLTETCISPLVVSFRGTLPTFQPCILPLPHDCSVTSQPPHIKCSLHLSRWAGSSIFWECPLFPLTFSCSLGTLLLTLKLGSGATSSGRSRLTSISPSLLPTTFIHSNIYGKPHWGVGE